MRRARFALVLAAAGARSPSQASTPDHQATEPVWAIDLVRTLPGQQDEYVRSIEANRAGARSIGRTRGALGDRIVEVD